MASFIEVQNIVVGSVVRFEADSHPPTTNFVDSAGNILLHVNIRYSEQTLVLNSKLNDAWGTEERPSGFPFDAAKVEVVVRVEKDGYRIIANSGIFSYFYRHRKAV